MEQAYEWLTEDTQSAVDTVNKLVNINKWVPSRDGNIIDINNKLSNFKLNNYNLAIKLFLDYENNIEKENILKMYFS
jgi:hypothetical protein